MQLIKYHTIREQKEEKVHLHTILTSDQEKVNDQLHVLAAWPPGKESLVHTESGLVGPWASLDILEKSKI